MCTDHEFDCFFVCERIMCVFEVRKKLFYETLHALTTIRAKGKRHQLTESRPCALRKGQA